ncbi:MAG TPA: hypothetical protein VHP58_04630 [Alphaproteobacteria bacterium]|nr:hypothetical protein [Alphaproteobacteria bacterium]
MRHERNFTPQSPGAFFGSPNIHRQAVALLDNTPNHMFIQKCWKKNTRKRRGWFRSWRFWPGRAAGYERCGCLFYLLTGKTGHSAAFHEARRRYNFPVEFSAILMRFYDHGTDRPAAFARAALRVIQPGTNLHVVARLYEQSNLEDQTWSGLQMLLKAHSPANLAQRPQLLQAQ